MFTIKINLQHELPIHEIQKQWNSCYRVAYNRATENMEDTAIDNHLNNLNNVSLIDKTMRMSARIKAMQNYSTIENKKAIFGSKKVFWQRKFGKISKAEYQRTRFVPIFQTGDAQQDGNRKFKLDVINNNRILFKPNKQTIIPVQLPKLTKRNKDYLCKLQELCEDKRASFSVELTSTSIHISIDENVFQTLEKPTIVKHRVLSFDMNPNYVGVSVVDFKNDGQDQEIVHKELLCLKELNVCKKGKTSTECKPDNHKRRHEIGEVGKHLVGLAKHYQAELVVFEKLDIKSDNKKKGKTANRLINNMWLRKLLAHVVKKRCNISQILVIETIPNYSSFIGCLQHPNETDAIAAALELARRGYLFYRIYKLKDLAKRDIVYPAYNRLQLATHWKEMPVGSRVKNWKTLYSFFKNSGFSYRVLWDKWRKLHPHEFQSLSLKSRSSKVERFVLE